MKLTLPITASVLLLGAFTALPAAETATTPATAAMPAMSDMSAVAATPATPARKFTEAELLETLGWIAGNRSQLSPFEFTAEELASITKGFQVAVAGKEPPYKPDEIGEQFSTYMEARQKAAEAKQLAEIEKKAAAGDPQAKAALEQIATQKAEAEKQAAAQKAEAEQQAIASKQNKADGEKFIAEKKLAKGVIALPSGLLYEIVQPGTGDYPKATDTVKVNYTGTLVDGKKFDSSADHGGAVEFPLNQVIPGWTEGIQKINKGGKIKLYIPSSLAYGDSANAGLPASSTLIFDVELIDINPPPAAAAPAAMTPAETAPAGMK